MPDLLVSIQCLRKLFHRVEFVFVYSLSLSRYICILQKGSRTTAAEEDFPWETAEKRPFISSKAIEKGEDYWIDGRDLEKEEARQQAVKNRLAMEGEIPKKKLQQEIVAPYKQNWIGLISVAIVVIATIISQNPELFESPLIPIPDL